MSDFLQNLERYDNVTLESIKNAAKDALPYEYSGSPWEKTSRDALSIRMSFS